MTRSCFPALSVGSCGFLPAVSTASGTAELQKRVQAQNFEEKEKELWVKLGLRGDLVVSVINQRGRRMELSFRVVSVSEESPTARMGVRAGDIIREINGRTLSGRHPFSALLGDKPELTKLKVIRGAEIVELVKP